LGAARLTCFTNKTKKKKMLPPTGEEVLNPTFLRENQSKEFLFLNWKVFNYVIP